MVWRFTGGSWVGGMLASSVLFGIFLMCLAAVQAGLYASLAVGGDSLRWLFYFDPRIGWSLFETIVREQEGFPGITSWATAVVAAIVGAMLIRNPTSIKIYFVAGAILALPTVAMFVLVVVQNLSPSEGFSVGEPIISGPIFLLVSVIPFTMAYRSRRAV